jgi:hypothetical protein
LKINVITGLVGVNISMSKLLYMGNLRNKLQGIGIFRPRLTMRSTLTSEPPKDKEVKLVI